MKASIMIGDKDIEDIKNSKCNNTTCSYFRKDEMNGCYLWNHNKKTCKEFTSEPIIIKHNFLQEWINEQEKAMKYLNI